MSNNSTISFAHFINYGRDNDGNSLYRDIQIPLIQRDYIQGRRYDDSSKKEVNRRNFVEVLLDSILNGKVISLDFIYGAKETYGVTDVRSQNSPFLPLDGQQRLTTLFLLHWVLMQKDQPNDYECRQEILKHFSWKTRITSERFCKKIVGTKFDQSLSLCEQIRGTYWFDHEMELDLTVQSMMMMIELFEESLSESKYCDSINSMAKNLFDGEYVTFEILDMDNYNLTDGLYVKMNARGKELTDFEHWKAQFIGFLSQWDDEKDKFCQSIEHEWNDVFWKRAYRECKDDSYPKIDNLFLNFFYNITRLLFFKYSSDANSKAEDYKVGVWTISRKVYEDPQARNELFDILDSLVEIMKNEHFFEDLFYNAPSTDWSNYDERVKLYGQANLNLFDIVCDNTNFQVSHILLYATLLYCKKWDCYAVDDNMRHYMRMVRNYLEEHNFFNRNYVTIDSQIRVTEMPNYCKSFEVLCSTKDPFLIPSDSSKDSYIASEQSKLQLYNNLSIRKLAFKLEDMTYTHGNLGAFMRVLQKCLHDTSLCETVWNAMFAFRNATPVQKVQLFLKYGYHGRDVKYCAYGMAVFLGGALGERWMVHFRSKTDDTQGLALVQWVERYVADFEQKGSLSTIVSEFKSITPQSPEEYMIKYDEICASQVYWRDNMDEATFYFAMMNPWVDLDMIAIHSISPSPLSRAYQVCPLSNAVCRKSDKFSLYHKKHRIGYSGSSSFKNGICINRQADDWDNLIFRMVFGRMEWTVETDYYTKLSENLKERLSPILDDEHQIKHYELKATQGCDLVENAAGYLNDVIAYFEQTGELN